jgi:hypothetical protein
MAVTGKAMAALAAFARAIAAVRSGPVLLLDDPDDLG